MTLRCKTQLFLGMILLSVLLILDVMFTNFLITSAEQTDRERMTRDLSRTVVTLNGEARTLSALSLIHIYWFSSHSGHTEAHAKLSARFSKLSIETKVCCQKRAPFV